MALPRYDFVSVLDRLLRGPAYIAVVGILLAGIVFFNVDVLELNHGIARTDMRATQLKRQNAALALQVARLGSSERIQNVALERGLVLPQPGDVRYLRAHPEDAVRALRVMTPPDPSSAAAALPSVVTQGGETVPSSAQSNPATTTPTTAAPALSQTTAQSTPTPTAQSTPPPTAQSTPPPTAQSTPTGTAQSTPTTTAGAAAAPATP